MGIGAGRWLIVSLVTPGGARTPLQTPRDRALRPRRNEGAPTETLAAEFGLSRRSVFRILARERAAWGGDA